MYSHGSTGSDSETNRDRPTHSADTEEREGQRCRRCRCCRCCRCCSKPDTGHTHAVRVLFTTAVFFTTLLGFGQRCSEPQMDTVAPFRRALVHYHRGWRCVVVRAHPEKIPTTALSHRYYRPLPHAVDAHLHPCSSVRCQSACSRHSTPMYHNTAV